LNVHGVGDDTAAARFTVPVRKSGFDVDVTVDLVFVRASRALSILAFASVLTPFDDDLRAALTRTAARRLEVALPPG
jgi:hypothetical protein